MDKYKYNRFSIRFEGYDYSESGYYFITMVTQDREKIFGVIQNKQMELNDIGRMIDIEWNQIPKRFKHAVLDKYIIMPDHFHGIIQINSNKKLSEHHKQTPLLNKNNVGTPLVGIHPVKLFVQNNKPYVHSEKLPVYDKSSFVKNHDIHSGTQDHFYGSPDVCSKSWGVSVGSQCMGTSPIPAGNKSLFDIIGAFKSITTHKYIDGVKNKNWPRFNKRLWQLRFHDRIIRNENELNRIREYIIANPVNYHSRTK